MDKNLSIKKFDTQTQDSILTDQLSLKEKR